MPYRMLNPPNKGIWGCSGQQTASTKNNAPLPLRAGKADKLSNKLNEKGLVPYPGIGDFKTLDIENIWLEATTSERDALLELFESWIEKLSLQKETGIFLPEGVITGLKRRIAELKAAKGG